MRRQEKWTSAWMLILRYRVFEQRYWGYEITGSADSGRVIVSDVGGVGSRAGAGSEDSRWGYSDAASGRETKPAEAQTERPGEDPAAEGIETGVARRLQDLDRAGRALADH